MKRKLTRKLKLKKDRLFDPSIDENLLRIASGGETSTSSSGSSLPGTVTCYQCPPDGQIPPNG